MIHCADFGLNTAATYTQYSAMPIPNVRCGIRNMWPLRADRSKGAQTCSPPMVPRGWLGACGPTSKISRAQWTVMIGMCPKNS